MEREDKMVEALFSALEKINERPKPFEFYTACDLWTDEHTSRRMLAYHLNEEVDVYSLKAFDGREEAAVYEEGLLDGFWSEKRYYGFLNTFKYEQEMVILDKYTIVERDRTKTVYNWLQYFSPELLEREFAEEGFLMDGLYSDVAGTPFSESSNEFAVVARKP